MRWLDARREAAIEAVVADVEAASQNRRRRWCRCFNEAPHEPHWWASYYDNPASWQRCEGVTVDDGAVVRSVN